MLPRGVGTYLVTLDNKQKTDKERLNAVFATLQKPFPLGELFQEIEAEMLALVHAERITVYQRSRKDQDIVSRYHHADGQVQEIRLALTMSSVAGYVGMMRKSVRVEDVYDAQSLAAIHPQLRFDDRFDRMTGFRTRSMMVLPIQFGDILLGLLQAINRVGGKGFTDQDMTHAKELTRVIGHKLRFEFECTRSPFDYLIQQGKLTPEQLAEIATLTDASRFSTARLLMREYGFTPEEVGESLERYYQVPFQMYQPGQRLPSGLTQGLRTTYLKRQQAWLPVAGDGERAVVLMEDPSDTATLLEMQNQLRSRHYELRVGFREDIQRFLEDALAAASSGDGQGLAPAAPVDEDAVALQRHWINRLLVTALRFQADSVRIETSAQDPTAGQALFIQGGKPGSTVALPSLLTPHLIQRLKTMGQIADLGSGSCRIKSGGKMLTLEIAVSRVSHGEQATLRLVED